MAKINLVLAPHRYGTSAVAGAMHYGGIFMGRRMLGAHSSNPRGHFENMDLLALDDRVIGDWQRPNTRHISSLQREAYATLIRGLEHYPIVGLKDPRLCITAKWLVPMIEHSAIVVVDREVDCAARSLVQRDKISLKRARAILDLYSAERHEFLQEYTGPHMSLNYDKLCDDPVVQVPRLLDFVYEGTGFAYTHEQLQAAIDFVDNQLRHFYPGGDDHAT